MTKLNNKIKGLIRPKIKLIRGTRFASALFIGVSVLIAAGVLFAANMYYDIDTGKVIVGEIQRITQSLEVVTSIDVGGTATTTGTSISFAGVGDITTGAASTWKTTAGDLTITSGAGDLIATGTDVRLVSSSGDISATSSNDIYLATNGTERLRILSGGNVGIATSSPSAKLAVTGDVMIDGDLKFVGNQTIEGSGTLTINPTDTLYLFTDKVSIDSSGNMILAGYASSTKVISPELEYSGNIKIDANSSGATTITVTNEGAGVADLSVEGDITVLGHKITLDTGQTIDAETTDHIIITSGGTGVLDIISGGVNITGNATTSERFYVTSGGASITGNVDISSGNLTVQGDILPESGGAGYTLGDASHYWDNLYVATTTIGSDASHLTIDSEEIHAPGALSVYLDAAGALTLQPQSNSDVVVNLGGTGQLKIGSSGQFYIDASGNATTSGTFHASTITTDSGDATVRKSGDQIVRGVIPIFGFDLPARCNTSCTGSWATISRTIENTAFFPSNYSGTSRKYRFSIRYADATTTPATRTTWQLATSSDESSYEFTLPPTDSTDIAKGFATTTNSISSLPTDDWFLRVKEGGTGLYDLQIYEILLIGLDEVN